MYVFERVLMSNRFEHTPVTVIGRCALISRCIGMFCLMSWMFKSGIVSKVVLIIRNICYWTIFLPLTRLSVVLAQQ